jgi:hypothetical protein
MTKPVFLNKKDYSFKGLDFDFLKKEGLSYVQQLAGENWTDYNEHDPGVTILEQLCFALTEISYKANQPIADILSENSSDKFSETFYTLSKIFTSNPVTVTDFRKLVIDRILGVRNVWFEPLNTIHNEFEINGLYNLYIEIPAKYKSETARVVEDTRQLLYEYSNICEDVENIFVLESKPIRLETEIELKKDAIVENVMAEILFRIREFLSHPVPFYSLEELVKEGHEINDIFCGPVLETGFIRDQDLYPKAKVIYNNELIKLVRSVEGILSIKSFSVIDSDPDIDGILMPWNMSPELDLDIAKHKFIFTKEHLKSGFDKNRVSLLLQEKNDTAYRAYKLSQYEGRNDVDIPAGKDRKLTEYYSIQHSFPEVYGIGQFGVPRSYPERRKAQVKQLKGYLLFFEQIMANYLAQLGNINELYSLDLNAGQSYFSQLPQDVPYFNEVYIDSKNIREVVTGYSSNEFTEKALAYTHNGKKNTLSSAETIITLGDDYLKRKNEVLSHLLARFGESIDDHELSGFLSTEESASTLENVLNIKINLLKKIHTLSRDKGKSFNRNKEYWGSDTNMSGMEFKVKTILDIPLAHKKISEVISDPAIFNNLHPDEHGYYGPRYPEVSEGEINKNYDQIDMDQFDSSFFEEKDTESYSPDEVPVNIDLFDYGQSYTSYKIGQDLADKINDYYSIVFYNKRTETWQKVEYYFSKDKAIRALKKLVEYIRFLVKQSEGFHVIENTLLRPMVEKKSFKLYICDEAFNVHLKSVFSVTIENIYPQAELLVRHILEGRIFSEKNSQQKFHFVIKDEHNNPLAISVETSDTVHESDEIISQVKNYFKENPVSDLYLNDKLIVHTDYFKEDAIFNHFFSHSINVIMPVWVPRFKDPDFFSYLEKQVINSVPPHISVNFIKADHHWLKSFEDEYGRWLKLYKEKKIDYKEINDCSYGLVKLLLEKNKYYKHFDHNTLRSIYYSV